jgi:hypothetical protein
MPIAYVEYCQVDVFAKALARAEGSYKVLVCVVCVFVSISVSLNIECNKKPLHLQWVGRRGQVEKEINEDKKKKKSAIVISLKRSTYLF